MIRGFRILSGIILFLWCVRVNAQEQQPFVFTIYGGLFFPSHAQFKANYQSSSDLIWGGGICLPLQSPLFITGDFSFFRASNVVQHSVDSVLKLEENFLHVGILDKQPLVRNLMIRLSGGLSYVTIKQKYSSSRSAEHAVEADKKIGYFGGAGIEQMLDEEGHLVIFGDVIYDYRRSYQKELSGDFGGIRIVIGIHMFLF